MDTLLTYGLSNAILASILAILAWTASRWFRSPALAHGLWLLVLLKLVTPPVVQIPLPWIAPIEVAIAERPEATAPDLQTAQLPVEQPSEVLGPEVAAVLLADPDEIGDLEAALPVANLQTERFDSQPLNASMADIPWQRLLLVTWFIGSIFWLGLAVLRTSRFSRLLKHSRPAQPALLKKAAELATRLELPYCPEILLVPGHLSPMLWGPGRRARLLLPADLMNQLDPEQQATLLAHELAHLKRRDHWVRALELIATALYWWHPAVWWAKRQLRESEEQCCDAWVVWALPGAGRAYATALVDVLDFLSRARTAVPALASGIGPVPDLKRRLTMIMRGTTPRSLSWTGYVGLAALAAMLLPVVPTFAQSDTKRKEKDDTPKAERVKKETIELELRLADDKDKKENKEKGEQVEKARAELNELIANMQKLQAQMKEAEGRMRQAKEKLARLAGEKGNRLEWRFEGRGDKPAPKITITIQEADGKVRTIEVPPGKADILRLVGPEFMKREGDPFNVPVVPPTPGRPGQPPQPPAGGPNAFFPQVPDARMRELEKRVDTLLKEMEMLRKELRGPRGNTPSPERRKDGEPERRKDGEPERRRDGQKEDGRKDGPNKDQRREDGANFFKYVPGPIAVPVNGVAPPAAGNRIFLFQPASAAPASR